MRSSVESRLRSVEEYVANFVTFVHVCLCVCAYVHGNFKQRRSRVTGALWQPRDGQHAILSVVQHLRPITINKTEKLLNPHVATALKALPADPRCAHPVYRFLPASYLIRVMQRHS